MFHQQMCLSAGNLQQQHQHQHPLAARIRKERVGERMSSARKVLSMVGGVVARSVCARMSRARKV
jgi:hypothetical protein